MENGFNFLAQIIEGFSLESPDIQIFIWGFFQVFFFIEAESFFPSMQFRGKRLRHGLRNLGIGLFVTLLAAVLFSIPTTWANWKAEELGFGLLRWLDWPSWVETSLAIVLIDLWLFSFHRLSHRVSFLWRFHRTHHSDDQVDATTAFRLHPGEMITATTLQALLIPLFGLLPQQLILYTFSQQLVGIFHHSNLALPKWLDRALRWLIVTPSLHRIHHAQDKSRTDSNYGIFLSFWDHLFASFHPPLEPDAGTFGLREFSHPKWQTVWGMLKTPFFSSSKTRYPKNFALH